MTAIPGFHPAELGAICSGAALRDWELAAFVLGPTCPALRIERRRMRERFSMMGRNETFRAGMRRAFGEAAS